MTNSHVVRLAHTILIIAVSCVQSKVQASPFSPLEKCAHVRVENMDISYAISELIFAGL